jgi:hypothetical protein
MHAPGNRTHALSNRLHGVADADANANAGPATHVLRDVRRMNVIDEQNTHKARKEKKEKTRQEDH